MTPSRTCTTLLLVTTVTAICAPPLTAQIGVGREDFVALLAQTEIEIDWRDIPYNTGEERLLGTVVAPPVSVELVGNPDDLNGIVVTFAPQATVADNIWGAIVVGAALQLVFPEWAEGQAWFNAQIGRDPEGEYTVTRRGIPVTVYPNSGLGGRIMLVVGR